MKRAPQINWRNFELPFFDVDPRAGVVDHVLTVGHAPTRGKQLSREPLGDCSMTELFAKFTSPVLSDFQVVEDRRKPPVIRCLVITAVEGSHRLILTNPKMLSDPDMPPPEIAEKLGRKWAELRIRKKRTQNLIRYVLDFESEEGFEFSVRVQECPVESVD